MNQTCSSCDICQYGYSHDYVKGNYYCKHPENPCRFSADQPMAVDCPSGVLDEWSYNFKYKPSKSDNNVSKEFMYEEIKKIMFGIKLKDNSTVMKELNTLKDKITSYREPYRCETCAVAKCDLYAAGCRNCSGWK